MRKPHQHTNADRRSLLKADTSISLAFVRSLVESMTGKTVKAILPKQVFGRTADFASAGSMFFCLSANFFPELLDASSISEIPQNCPVPSGLVVYPSNNFDSWETGQDLICHLQFSPNSLFDHVHFALFTKGVEISSGDTSTGDFTFPNLFAGSYIVRASIHCTDDSPNEIEQAYELYPMQCPVPSVFTLSNLGDGTLQFDFQVSNNDVATINLVNTNATYNQSLTGTSPIIFSEVPNGQYGANLIYDCGHGQNGYASIQPIFVAPACVAVTLPSFSLPDAQVGLPYSYSVPLSGTAPFTANIASHNGISAAIVGSSLVFSGTPNTVGNPSFTGTVTNCAGGGSQNISAAIHVQGTRFQTIGSGIGDDHYSENYLKIFGSPGETVTVKVTSLNNTSGPGTIHFNATLVTALNQTFTFTLDSTGNSATIVSRIDEASPYPGHSYGVTVTYTITAATGNAIGSPDHFDDQKIYS